VIALATSLVFARLAPGSVQAEATPAFGEVAGAGLEGLAVPCLAEQFPVAADLLVAQPAAARPTARNMIAQVKRSLSAAGFIRSP